MDTVTPQQRSSNMRAIKSKDTTPEMIVRRLTHGLGFRYRLHCKDLPGKPDLVFSPRRKVIFVHGCFWHQHRSEGCLSGKIPRSNSAYWEQKLTRNVTRDRECQDRLLRSDWDVLVIWECETKKSEELEARLRSFLA